LVFLHTVTQDSGGAEEGGGTQEEGGRAKATCYYHRADFVPNFPAEEARKAEEKEKAERKEGKVRFKVSVSTCWEKVKAFRFLVCN